MNKIRENEDLQLENKRDFSDIEMKMKTEVKFEVKEVTIEDFDAREQFGIELITNKDFDYASCESKFSTNVE